MLRTFVRAGVFRIRGTGCTLRNSQRRHATNTLSFLRLHGKDELQRLGGLGRVRLNERVASRKIKGGTGS
jgi:hypothetical protein